MGRGAGVEHAGGYLLWSDIPNNVVHKWTPGGAVSEYLKPSGYSGTEPFTGPEPGSNGLTFDREGHLILCQHGDRRIARLDAPGKLTALADKYEGKRLNSPNDVVVHSSGAIYFTDPPYGLPGRWDDPKKELPFQGVYRRATDGTVTLLTKELYAPNGLAFSPDEKTLYVAQSDPKKAIWMAYPVKARRHDRRRQGVRRRNVTRGRRASGPARRNEGGYEGQHLDDRAGWRVDLVADWRAPGHDRHGCAHRKPRVGRRRQHALHHGQPRRLAGQDKGDGEDTGLDHRPGQRATARVRRVRAAG